MSSFWRKKTNIVNFTMVSLFLSLPVFVYAASGNPRGDISNQLKINQWTLSNSTDEQIRIDTAIELLGNPSPEARQILLEVLASADNAAAGSVCKAISKFRSSSNLITNKGDFIGPLIKILNGQNVEAARLAAQAALVFNFKEVKRYFEQTIKNRESPPYAKRNVIYALQVRSDRESVFLLIDLLDSDDSIISSAAAESLQEWLPIGADKQQWQKVRRDIERGRLDFVRERVLSQQDKICQLNEDVSKWQKRYLASLDNIYLATADDNARAKFVVENLAFEHSSVKLWAIEKINMWQKSGKSLPLDILNKPLIAIVSDSNPAVRLAAAKLLGLLTNIDSADALLTQLKTETFADVKTEILVSLSHICNFALSPGADVKIDPQVRIETLKTTVEFFKDTKPVIAAEIIRNLLLQDGLQSSGVKPYFEFIAASYTRTQDEQVRIPLLEEMTRLCGSDSFYKIQAGEVFRSIFLSAINDKSSQVAAPAVTGLLRVDQAGAFEILKSKGFTGHSNDKIRGELISAAAQIGTQQDLDWLAALVTSAGSDDERQRAADAMVNIFQYCKTDVLISWAKQLSGQAKSKNDGFLLTKAKTLLEAAEKKADAEQDANTLISIRRTLADYYAEASQYALAAKYYGMLLLVAADQNEKGHLTARMLDVDIRDGQAESAKQLLANILLSSDIDKDKEVAKVLDKYFSENQDKEAAKQIFLAIASVGVSDAAKYPLWSDQLAKWQSLLKIKSINPSAEPNVSVPAKSGSDTAR